MIIGLSGYARAGKDETAKTLKDFDFKRYAFADKVRAFLLELNPDVRYDGVLDKHKGYTPVKKIIEEYGWDGVKTTGFGLNVRALLQRLGTEAGRKVIGENVWVDALLNDIDVERAVITDVRFPNEADAIKDRGGEIWRITRPTYGPVNEHFSETAMDDYKFDIIIDNDGTRDELAAKVALALPW